MRVILLGAPGSGKGTQAAGLAQQLKVARISTGDIFRDEITKKTELGTRADEYVKSGRLVPDQLVLNMVFKRLDQSDCSGGFLLDGFPRTVDQAEGLNSYLAKKSLKIDYVFYLDVSEDVLIQRLSQRRHCPGCQMVYNLLTNPPQADSVCDRCGGKLISRGDDEPNTLKKRLMVYQELTSPLVAYYKASGHFAAIDGAKVAADVAQEIAGHLGGAKI
ncbi:MAG: adenylate kinase [Elusimicrobia bacterium]|nr:adenylate kinase [Elusimicrobiota bacterium]